MPNFSNKISKQAMDKQEWDKAVEYRGKSFARNLETYKTLTRLKPPSETKMNKGCGKVRKKSFIH